MSDNNTVFQPITAQMIFDAAWQKFIVEEAPPAVGTNDGKQYFCKYLTPDGRKCAVGLCIPDGHPIQKEDSCLYSLCAGEWSDMFDLSDEEMNCLQEGLHDELLDISTGKWLYSTDEMKKKYVQIAETFNLTIPLS